jgi:hypothetical protein
MVSDVFTEWEEVEKKDWPGGKANVLASWTIQNVKRRNSKLELEEIEGFPGCPLDVFVKALNEADAKKATGPAPSPHTKSDRVARQLKKAGYNKIAPGVVGRFHALSQKHLNCSRHRRHQRSFRAKPGHSESPTAATRLTMMVPLPHDARSLHSCDAGSGEFPASTQPPNSTACIMRPGTNVNRPAMTNAPKNIPNIARR